MKSKELRKTHKQLSKDTIKEIKRLYPIVSVHHYDTDLEYIEIDPILLEYDSTIRMDGIVKRNNDIDIVVSDSFGVDQEDDLPLEITTIGDQLYILEELERLSKPQKKNKIL